MNLSDYKRDARNKMSGKWTQCAIITFVYFLIFFIAEGIEDNTTTFFSNTLKLILILFEIPLFYAYITSFFKYFKINKSQIIDIFDYCTNNFLRYWGLFFYILFRLIVPIILLIISYILITFGMYFSNYFTFLGLTFNLIFLFGIIINLIALILLLTQSYYYKLSIIILNDKNCSIVEAVKNSKLLMKNNRANLFYLQLSFIGWFFISLVSFGIGFLFTVPYYRFTEFVFYKNLSNK